MTPAHGGSYHPQHRDELLREQWRSEQQRRSRLVKTYRWRKFIFAVLLLAMAGLAIILW